MWIVGNLGCHAGGVVCGRRGAKDRHARRSSRMAARLAPRCVVGCGWRGYGRCGEGGQAGLRRRVGQQHVTTPSLRQKT